MMRFFETLCTAQDMLDNNISIFDNPVSNHAAIFNKTADPAFQKLAEKVHVAESWDEFFNDFIYCILGIGAIEELMKIIPLFLVMFFSKQLKEPIDYVVFASISALGFAFIENLIYFDEAGLKTIQGRSLSSTVTHMFNSSLIAL